MLDNFFEAYYNQKGKKGYEVLGLKLTLIFIMVVVALAISLFFLSYIKEWWVLLITLVIFISIRLITKRIDGILLNYLNDRNPELKRFIRNYLETILKFNHSNQFKELASQLYQKGEKNIKSYNLIPHLTMILTVILFLGTLIVQIYPEYLIDIIVYSIIITVIVLSINPLINGFASLFLNEKSKKMVELSNVINEIYIEESIKENAQFKQNAKNMKKNNKRRR